jgi:hypothetical protein
MLTKKKRSRNHVAVPRDVLKAVSDLRESMVALKKAIAALNGQEAARGHKACAGRRRPAGDARWNRS